MDKFAPEKIYILSPTAEVDQSQQTLIDFLLTYKDMEDVSRFNKEQQLITDPDKMI